MYSTASGTGAYAPTLILEVLELWNNVCTYRFYLLFVKVRNDQPNLSLPPPTPLTPQKIKLKCDYSNSVQFNSMIFYITAWTNVI